MYLSGWQPYSIRIGNSWIGYRGFEPISSWLRAAGDLSEGWITEQGYVGGVASFTSSWIKQFAENPFLLGVRDIMDAIEEPDYFAPKFVANLTVGATLPVVLQQWGTRVWDPVVRKPIITKEGKTVEKLFGEKAWMEIKAKLPFGIAQVGKVYRNEISPRQFIIRVREFTQMELEVFFAEEQLNDPPRFEELADEILPILTRDQQAKNEEEPMLLTAADAVEKGILPNN